MKLYLIAIICLAVAPLAAQETAQPSPIYDPAKGEPGARHADISDDGKLVVFSLWGDLWRWDAEDGATTQLTMHEAYDSYPRLSPDGGTIAFSSDRDGNYNVYLLDIRGGVPGQAAMMAHVSYDFRGELKPPTIAECRIDVSRVGVTSLEHAIEIFDLGLDGDQTPRSVGRGRAVHVWVNRRASTKMPWPTEVLSKCWPGK